jgi:hypothetical protein
MGKVYRDLINGGVIVERDDGARVWSSSQPPANLLPEAQWLTLSRAITFPDFTKFCNYAHQRVSNASGGPPWALGGSGDVCQTVTMIEALQFWDSGDTVIGSVPAGVNYIDVRVNLAVTKAPYNVRDQDTPPLIAPNQWVFLPGGSCLIESNTIWRRLFTVSLGAVTGATRNVILRAKQSVAALPDNAVARYGGIYDNSGRNRDAWITASYADWGWVTGAGGAWQGTQRNGHPAALIEVKQFSGNDGATPPTMGAKHPTRERACSVNMSGHDFSSSYSGTIVIRPGYIKTT